MFFTIKLYLHLHCVLMLNWGCPRGVMVIAIDCGVVVREFILQSRYYVHFRANTHGKGMNPLILPAVRVFANGPGDLGSIPGRVIPKTLKMELDTTLLNTQHYKVRFKGKVEQSREWSSALPYTLV